MVDRSDGDGSQQLFYLHGYIKNTLIFVAQIGKIGQTLWLRSVSALMNMQIQTLLREGKEMLCKKDD